MKRYVAICTIFAVSIVSAVDLSVQEIGMMVKKIHQRRTGVDLPTLEHTTVPFVQVKQNENGDTELVTAESQKNKAPKGEPLVLHAILGDKAFINGKWYKTKDHIHGFELVYIGKRGVVLKSDKLIRTLFLSKKQKTSLLKFKER